MQLHTRHHCSSSLHPLTIKPPSCSRVPHRAPATLPHTRRVDSTACAATPSGGGDLDADALREAVRSLKRSFYAVDAPPERGDGSSSSSSSSSKGSGMVWQGSRPQPVKLQGARIQQLPLWRVEWAILPGMQEILHVLAPHYLHMYDALFARPRPWVFGHLYTPGGSRSLGSPEFALASGSQQPLVGSLMQVTRAVRLRDGKLLLLATALARFRVLSEVRALPYSEADVELLEDCELLEPLNDAATAAVMQAAGDGVSVQALMAASSTAAREAAAAAHWAWSKGYELQVAARQEWPGPGPREGETDFETAAMVQELAEQGVAEVLPLPDGVVIGRCDLQAVAASVDAAVQAALQRVGAELNQQQQQEQQQDGREQTDAAAAAGGSPLSSTEGAAAIRSLNTTVQRGVALQPPEFRELTGSKAASSSLEDVLLLEAAVWQQLDVLAALSARVKGRRHSLPFGLLQLRPPPPQPGLGGAAAAAAAAGAAANMSSSSSRSTSAASAGSHAGEDVSEADSETAPSPDAASSSSSSSGAAGSSLSSRSSMLPPGAGSSTAARSRSVQGAASDWTDVHADPLWPPLRRAARLSWAAALATGEVAADKPQDHRQALLEAPSVACRLRYVLAILQKHAKVLAALAAVKDVQQE